jgi:DNA-binding SARP family transcriptional activator
MLGSFEAMLGDRPLTAFSSDKVRALLAYLAVEDNRPHRREALAGLLWPDRPDSVARTYLRNALVSLRTVIGDREAAPPFLLVTRETIQFNQASDHWLDVTAFRALAKMQDPAPLGSAELEEGIALYRGDFLEGFGLRDSPAFEDWMLLLRERLQRQVLSVLTWLSRHYEQQGDLERGTRTLGRGSPPAVDALAGSERPASGCLGPV